MAGARVVDISARVAFRTLQVAALVFCLVPAFLIFGLSFFKDLFENFPPHQFTVSLYVHLVTAQTWRRAVWVSLKLGVPTAALTVLAVTPAVLALERAKIRGKSFFEFVALLPLLMPAVAYVVALYVIYLKLGWTGQLAPLILVESIVASPVAFLIMRAAIQRIPPQLDYVAMSLGASRLRALWDISATLLRPAMLVGALFALIHVFNDAVFVTFLGGPSTVTVSKAIFDALELAVDPAIAALSAVFIVVMAIVITAATLLNGRPPGTTR